VDSSLLHITLNILYDYQFGFRRYDSTTLALLDVVDQIYQHLYNRDMVLEIYLDLQKAFDTVDHNILLAFWLTMVLEVLFITGLNIIHVTENMFAFLVQIQNVEK